MKKTKKVATAPVATVSATNSELPEKIFNVRVNSDLLTQYLRVYFANQRAGNASTKTKGEVSGGGRKPWRQKGTGRARQGSIRAPQWVGGGVVHGPKPKDWSLYLPSKMKRGALLSALSLKAQAGKVDVWEDFSFGKESKTKDLVKKMEDLNLGGKVLFIRTKGEEDIVRIGRNLPMVEIEAVDSLNAFSVAWVKRVVLSKSSLSALEKFINKTE
jgi:large subunit ribosomal protein L4